MNAMLLTRFYIGEAHELLKNNRRLIVERRMAQKQPFTSRSKCPPGLTIQSLSRPSRRPADSHARCARHYAPMRRGDCANGA